MGKGVIYEDGEEGYRGEGHDPINPIMMETKGFNNLPHVLPVDIFKSLRHVQLHQRSRLIGGFKGVAAFMR